MLVLVSENRQLAATLRDIDNSYTLCLKKVHPFYFCDYSVKCLPILIIFGLVVAQKMCNLIKYSFLVISSFFYE